MQDDLPDWFTERPVTSIEELFHGAGDDIGATHAGVKAVWQAESIFGFDTRTEHPFLVFDGAPEGAEEPSADHRILIVGLDQASDDLEKLVALVELVKGRHDYRDGGQLEPGSPLMAVPDPEIVRELLRSSWSFLCFTPDRWDTLEVMLGKRQALGHTFR